MLDANPSIAHDELVKQYVKGNRIDLTGLSPQDAVDASDRLARYFERAGTGVDTTIAAKVMLGNNDSWAVSR